MFIFKKIIFIFLFISHSLCAVTTLHVTLSSDANPGGIGDIGDLRYCLNTMNQDLNTTPDDYVIVFDFPMTITLGGILPIINNSSNPVNITIGNSGSIPTVMLDGSSAYSGLFIPMGSVTIQNMIFQNFIARGGDGGNGISGGGGGMGAGAAIYAPQSFLQGSSPFFSFIQNNSSSYVDSIINGAGIGLFVNTGLNVQLSDCFLLGIFGEYSHENQMIHSNIPNVYSNGDVQIGGFAFGLSLGYEF